MQLREGERYPEGERAGREERFDFDALVRREVAARLYVQQPDTSDGLDAVEDGFSFCSAVAVSPIVPFCHRGALCRYFLPASSVRVRRLLLLLPSCSVLPAWLQIDSDA